MLKVPGWFTSTANWKLAGRWTAVDGDAAKLQPCFLVIIHKLERAITSEDWSTWIVMLNYVVIARSESSQSSLAVPVLALNAYFTITLKPFLPSIFLEGSCTDRNIHLLKLVTVASCYTSCIQEVQFHCNKQLGCFQVSQLQAFNFCLQLYYLSNLSPILLSIFGCALMYWLFMLVR